MVAAAQRAPDRRSCAVTRPTRPAGGRLRARPRVRRPPRGTGAARRTSRTSAPCPRYRGRGVATRLLAHCPARLPGRGPVRGVPDVGTQNPTGAFGSTSGPASGRAALDRLRVGPARARGEVGPRSTHRSARSRVSSRADAGPPRRASHRSQCGRTSASPSRARPRRAVVGRAPPPTPGWSPRRRSARAPAHPLQHSTPPADGVGLRERAACQAQRVGPTALPRPAGPRGRRASPPGRGRPAHPSNSSSMCTTGPGRRRPRRGRAWSCPSPPGRRCRPVERGRAWAGERGVREDLGAGRSPGVPEAAVDGTSRPRSPETSWTP